MCAMLQVLLLNPCLALVFFMESSLVFLRCIKTAMMCEIVTTIR